MSAVSPKWPFLVVDERQFYGANSLPGTSLNPFEFPWKHAEWINGSWVRAWYNHVLNAKPSTGRGLSRGYGHLAESPYSTSRPFLQMNGTSDLQRIFVPEANRNSSPFSTMVSQVSSPNAVDCSSESSPLKSPITSKPLFRVQSWPSFILQVPDQHNRPSSSLVSGKIKYLDPSET